MENRQVRLYAREPGLFPPLGTEPPDDDAVQEPDALHPPEVAARSDQGMGLRLPRVASSA